MRPLKPGRAISWSRTKLGDQFVWRYFNALRGEAVGFEVRGPADASTAQAIRRCRRVLNECLC